MSVISNITKFISAIASATAKFGDVANGNYAEFESDGTLKLNGNATVWDDLEIPLLSLDPAGAIAPPTPKEFMDCHGYPGSAGGASYIIANHFSPTTQQDLSFSKQILHEWKVGTTLKPHIHWLVKTNSAGDFKIGIEFCIVSINRTCHVTCPATTHRSSNGTTKTLYFATEPGVQVYQQIVVASVGGTGYNGNNNSDNATFIVLSKGNDGSNYYITYVGASSSTESKTADTGGSVIGYSYRMEATATQSANTQGAHKLKSFGDLEAPLHNISALILGRLYRVQNSAVPGGLNEDWVGMSLDFHFEKDTVGSRQPTSK